MYKKLLALFLAFSMVMTTALGEVTVSKDPAAEIRPDPAPTAYEEEEVTPEPVIQETPIPEPTDEETATPESVVDETSTPPPLADETATPVPTIDEMATVDPTPPKTVTPEPVVQETASPEPLATPEPSIVATLTPEPTQDESAADALAELISHGVKVLFNDENTTECDDVSELESKHPYTGGVHLWTLAIPGTIAVKVTFDKDTALAKEDRIALMLSDQADDYMLYTGGELAGQTLTVNSSVLRIGLLNVGEDREWGFRVSSIVTIQSETPTATPVPALSPTPTPDVFIEVDPSSASVRSSCALKFESTLLTKKSVKLTFIGDGQQHGYMIYRRAAGEPAQRRMATLAATATSWIDNALPADVNVEYRIYELDANGNCMPAYLSTFAYSLAAPSSLTVARASTGTRLNWSRVSGATGYTIYRRAEDRGYSKLATIPSAATLTYTDTKADSYSTVCYYVMPYRIYSRWTMNGLTSIRAYLRLNYDTPSAPKITQLTYATKLTWAKVSGAQDYMIYRRTPDSSLYTRLGTTTSLSWTDTTAQNGQCYIYIFRPRGMVTGKLVSRASAEAVSYNAMVTRITVATSSSETATITWPSLPGAARYRVVRYATNNSEIPVAKSVNTVTSPYVSFTATGLTPGVMYQFTVQPYAEYPVRSYVPGRVSNRINLSVYRALLIGQTYEGTPSALYGCVNDRNAMGNVLSIMNATPYTVTKKENITGQQILSGIATAFAGATVNDISLFYYSGHGVYAYDQNMLGALCGSDIDSYNSSAYVTPTQLRNALDRIPGTKIVIIDACHSGNMIGKSILGRTVTSDAMLEQMITDSFISAFANTLKSNLAVGGYQVLVAAHSTQSSVEIGNNFGRRFGLFTYSMCLGCGFNESTNSFLGTLKADRNGNGMISLSELFSYTDSTVRSLNVSLGTSQVTQVYPSNSNFELFGQLP